MAAEVCVHVAADTDIVTARQAVRALAAELGFSTTDRALIATAVSELARNLVLYAREGDMLFSSRSEGARRGLRVVVEDHGPGIANLDLALQDGFSTGGGLGLGLPGARRIMDDFVIESAAGRGTTITMMKWCG